MINTFNEVKSKELLKEYKNLDLSKLNDVSENITVLTLTGLSGAGKSFFAHELESKRGIPELISHTTRPSRGDGDKMHCVKRTELKNFNFIERTEFRGEFYGISLETLIFNALNSKKLDTTRVVTLVCTLDGAEELEEYFKSNDMKKFKVVKCLILTPLDIIKERNIKRNVDRDVDAEKVLRSEELLKENYDLVVSGDQLSSHYQQVNLLAKAARISYDKFLKDKEKENE